MPVNRFLPKASFVLAGAAAVLLIAVTPVAAASKSSIEKVENNLAAAGFVVKPANTPERVDMLTRLPANKFVQHVSGDIVSYVYADPKACGCLYVGTQEAYGQYQRAMQAKKLVDLQAMAAENYRDARWNWGAWGPWGPRWGFGRLGW